MTQSAHIREINLSDFQRMHKNQYPIIICYNGHDHYASRRSSDPQNYYRWKMEKQLEPILSARLLVIEEVDRSKLPQNVLQQVNQVEATIVQALPIISPHSNAAHLRRIASDQPQRGPVFFPASCSSSFWPLHSFSPAFCLHICTTCSPASRGR